MQTRPRRSTLNSSNFGGIRRSAPTRLGGVIVRPGAGPVVLEVVLVESGAVAEGMINSWDIGDGRSVAVVRVKEKDGGGSGVTLRLLA